MTPKHVAGKDVGHIMVYALSTCPWCRKAKELLGKMGVAYDYVDVDRLDADEFKSVVAALEKYNPTKTVPVIVTDKTVIIGFKEDDIKGIPVQVTPP